MLSILEPVSELLQKKFFIYCLSQKYDQLIIIRCETALNKILLEADNFIILISESLDITPLSKNHLRKKILPGKKVVDEPWPIRN